MHQDVEWHGRGKTLKADLELPDYVNNREELVMPTHAWHSTGANLSSIWPSCMIV